MTSTQLTVPCRPSAAATEPSGDVAALAQAQITGFFLPTRYFLVAGVGDASVPLVAFDRALLDAGVADVNLIKLSSIVGPHCSRISPIPLTPGALVPVAYASRSSSQPGELIASAVAVAHPTDPERAALVMEHSGSAPCAEVEAEVIRMAIEGLESRGLRAARVESVGIEHVVRRAGATFAAVVEI
jgi:arginine decarboxylase